METINLTFSGIIEATDSTRRIIAGKILPFGEIGHTNVGDVVFEKGSVNIPNSRFKLLLEHDPKKPLGRAVNVQQTDPGIYAQFKVAETTAGNDALIEAADLRDGLSVGVKLNRSEERNGIIYVTSAELSEVSLVHTPAFASAAVESVLASENEPEEKQEEIPTEENQPTESEASVENATPTPEVEADKVEASRPVNNTPIYTKPRVNTNITAGQYAMAQVRATQGDTDARDLVAALQIATVAENTGMVPPTYLRDVIGVIDASRPFIDSIERAPLPAAGMKIFTPVLGTQATVALTAEGAEFSSTDTAVTFQEDSVVKFAGANVVDVELFDRSDPSFADLLIRELAASYAQKTDAYAAKIAVDNCGSTNNTTIYKTIAEAIADSYGVMRFTPNNLMVAPSGGKDGIDFAGLLGAVDTTGRPIFAAAAPQNANGLVTQGSTNGTVAGLNLVVDPNYTGDASNVKYAMVYPTAAMRFHESPTIELRANIVANGRIEIGLYGYVAVVNRYPTAFRGLTVTP